MVDAPEDTRDAIWDRIIGFAFEVETLKGGFGPRPRSALRPLIYTRTAVSRVSRTFRVMPVCYHMYDIWANQVVLEALPPIYIWLPHLSG